MRCPTSRFVTEPIEIVESHDADIVLLQEVDDGVPRSREMDLARELGTALGYAHLAVGHNVSLRKGRYGNATLSRHPILRERNIDLTIGLWKRRGCQHTAIVVEGQGRRRQLEVFNLHLGLSSRQRERQVGLLARCGELTSLDPEAACLVGGDFNDWRSRLAPLLTDGLRFRSAGDRSGRGGRPLATYPSFFPSGPLDRIYYRGALKLLAARRCRLGLSRVASDHLPLVADFEME